MTTPRLLTDAEFGEVKHQPWCASLSPIYNGTDGTSAVQSCNCGGAQHEKDGLAIEALTDLCQSYMAEIDTAREKVANFMLRHSFATGHGDTLDDLLSELAAQMKERAADRTALLSHAEAQAKRIGELEVALNPFAEIGEGFSHPDLKSVLDTEGAHVWGWWKSGDPCAKYITRIINVGHMRRAAAALTPKTQKEG